MTELQGMAEHLADFHFLRPWWFAATPLLLLPLLLRNSSGAAAWSRAVAPELLAVLLESGGTRARRAVATFHTTTILGLFAAVFGLAGPTLERLPQPVAAQRDAVVIVLDLSLSMYARDLQPSRVTHAHQRIARILANRAEGLTGLVVYAGDAHVVTPLTNDVRNIENLLPALVPDIMPVAGSRPGPAFVAARALFPNVGAPRGRILLVTDGVDDPEDVLRHRNPAFPISILGVGTAEGAPIPLDFRGVPGRFLADAAGTTVLTRLDATKLADIASAAYGEYRTLADSEEAWTWPDPGEADPGPAPDSTFDDWHDLGYWFVFPALATACFGFRRGVLAVLAAALVLPIAHAQPADDDAGRCAPLGVCSMTDLWQRRDQQAYEMLRSGRADAAVTLFDEARFPDARWLGVARYHSGDLEGAASRFREDRTPTGQYNLGNALARLGALEAATAAYDRVLAVEPDHADALYNRALVAAVLEQRSRSRDDEADGASSGRHAADGETGSDATPNAMDQQGPTSRPENAVEAAAADALPTESPGDARTRWLESVPDDPGGLLRRKFRHETNQRLREGDYRSRERGPAW